MPAPSSAAPKTSGLAIASLALSLGTLILGPLGYIPGIVCGHLARRQIRREPALGGNGLAKAGLIVGYGFLGLTVAFVTAFFLFFAARISQIKTEMARQQGIRPPIVERGERPVRRPPPVRPSPPGRPPRAQAAASPMANLAGAVSGTVGGQEFQAAAAELNKTVGMLELNEGRAVRRGERVLIFLFPKQGEPLDGKTWDITSGSGTMGPHVHLNWYEGDALKTKALTDGYDLALRFGNERDGRIDGHVKLKLAKEPATEIEGDFIATVR